MDEDRNLTAAECRSKVANDMRCGNYFAIGGGKCTCVKRGENPYIAPSVPGFECHAYHKEPLAVDSCTWLISNNFHVPGYNNLWSNEYNETYGGMSFIFVPFFLSYK